MKASKLLVVIMWFVSMAQGQSYDQCQQQCTNAYNVCLSTADQQLSQCLAAVQAGEQQCTACTNRFPGQACPTCSAPNGCPTGVPSCRYEDCCHSNASAQTSQCNSDHDTAYAACGSNYSTCSTSCGDFVIPGVALRKLPERRNSVSDAMWATLMRKLSRPEKLKLVL